MSRTAYHKMRNRSLGLLAQRLLFSGKGKIPGRHWLTFCGITLGVFALLTVSSVMNGFDRDMRQRIIGTRAEIRIEGTFGTPINNYPLLVEKLARLPYVKAFSPVVRNELMLVKDEALAATVSFGIDLKQHQKVSPVLLPLFTDNLPSAKNQWLQGLVNGNPTPASFDQNGIILGAALAQSLDANVGDTIQLISPLASQPTPLGMLPKTKKMRVDAIFIAGMPDYDRLYSYIPLSAGQFFSGYENQIDQVELKADNPNQLKKITARLRKDLPDYKVEDWSAFDTNLYGAMKFEKALMLTILCLMFIIAAFNMSGNIFRTIVQKRRLIGILKTIGYRNKDLVQLFLRQGLSLAIAGILCGILLSLILLQLQANFGFIHFPVGDQPDLVLPVFIKLSDYLLIPLAALLITFLSILLPARQAGKIDPIPLIREIT
ncbi:MAG TPA: ABC transporter permease [Candidatus Cloacimonadota bacterium]|nr:ABC transporter permease [Candidatus Cloacimonadota bacterium]